MQTIIDVFMSIMTYYIITSRMSSSTNLIVIGPGCGLSSLDATLNLKLAPELVAKVSSKKIYRTDRRRWIKVDAKFPKADNKYKVFCTLLASSLSGHPTGTLKTCLNKLK